MEVCSGYVGTTLQGAGVRRRFLVHERRASRHALRPVAGERSTRIGYAPWLPTRLCCAPPVGQFYIGGDTSDWEPSLTVEP